MALFRRKEAGHQKRGIRFLSGDTFADIIGNGYTRLDECPEVVAACHRIAQLIGSMTIYLMANTERGDVRVVNELSRKIDIAPCKTMTRSSWMDAIVMNLLLYGDGNSIVFPHTQNGLLDSLEPIEARRVTFSEMVGAQDYRVNIDGKPYDPSQLLHFVLNPDKDHLWHGQGFRVPLRGVVENLAQAQATTKGFMNSKWKPSIIVKVDGLVDEFSSPSGRKKLTKSYLETEAGEPWIIPADTFAVEQVRPLSLQDLAIADTMKLEKQTVAAILGIPAYVLGVGDFKADEWDNFINTTIRGIAQGIEQELTRKLIISPKMYLKFNSSKLYSYDLQKLSSVFGALYDKGIITGNEVREKLGMQPIDGLDELIVLENYIPVTEVGKQKKLKGENE